MRLAALFAFIRIISIYAVADWHAIIPSTFFCSPDVVGLSSTSVSYACPPGLAYVSGLAYIEHCIVCRHHCISSVTYHGLRVTFCSICLHLPRSHPFFRAVVRNAVLLRASLAYPYGAETNTFVLFPRSSNLYPFCSSLAAFAPVGSHSDRFDSLCGLERS